MSGSVAITTIDNPYDPFEQFGEWLSYDEFKGYHTVSLLGRLLKANESASPSEIEEDVERAIDEIIAHDPLNIYKKVRND